MIYYFITISLVFIFAIIALTTNIVATQSGILSKPPGETKIFLFLIMAVLVFVAGFRYYVGTDFGAYYRFVDNHVPNWLSTLKELDEPGFPILAVIINWFTSNGSAFIFVTSAITIISILSITFKYTDTYLFSTALFIFMGVWHGTFNGVRQFFAAAIICLGHRLILEKKIVKYMLCVIIAFLFHKSAIIMVMAYFILRRKVNLRNILLLTAGSIILLYNYEFIFSFIGGLKDSQFTIEEGSYYLNQVNILRVLVCVVPSIFCLFIYMKSEKTKEQTFYLNCLILYAMLSIIGMNSPYISRINIYLMVLLPLAMGKLVVFENKKSEFVIKTGIVVLFLIFWFYEVSNSSTLSNFRWVFGV